MENQFAIYHWRSTLLKQYRDGHFIVLASSLYEARAAIHRQYDEWLRENRSWLDPASPDDAEEFADLRQKLEYDLARQPEIISAHTAIFINGSE